MSDDSAKGRSPNAHRPKPKDQAKPARESADGIGLNDPYLGRREALASFGDKLSFAQAIYRDRADSGAGRWEAIAAVQATVDLIRARPDLRGLELSLVRLLNALHDLEKGKRSPLLEPIAVGHRPPDSSVDQSIKGAAAAAMGLLMRAGRRKGEAAKTVARRLDSLGFKRTDSGKAVTGGTVAEWRERARVAMDNDNSDLVHEYRVVMKIAHGQFDNDVQAAAEAVMNNVLPMRVRLRSRNRE